MPPKGYACGSNSRTASVAEVARTPIRSYSPPSIASIIDMKCQGGDGISAACRCGSGVENQNLLCSSASSGVGHQNAARSLSANSFFQSSSPRSLSSTFACDNARVAFDRRFNASELRISNCTKHGDAVADKQSLPRLRQRIASVRFGPDLRHPTFFPNGWRTPKPSPAPCPPIRHGLAELGHELSWPEGSNSPFASPVPQPLGTGSQLAGASWEHGN